MLHNDSFDTGLNFKISLLGEHCRPTNIHQFTFKNTNMCDAFTSVLFSNHLYGGVLPLFNPPQKSESADLIIDTCNL